MRFCSCYITDSHFCFVLRELDKCKLYIQLDYSCNLTVLIRSFSDSEKKNKN